MSLGAVQRIVDMVAGKASVQLLNFHGISTKHNSFFIANNSIQACGLGDAGLGVIVNKLLTSTSLRVLSLRSMSIQILFFNNLMNSNYR